MTLLHQNNVTFGVYCKQTKKNLPIAKGRTEAANPLALHIHKLIIVV